MVSYRYTFIGGRRQAAQDHDYTFHAIRTSPNEKIILDLHVVNFHWWISKRGSTPVVPSAPSESIAFCAVEELRGRKHPGLLGPFPPIEYIFRICVQVGAQNFWSSIAPSRPLATSKDSKAFIVCCMIPTRSWLVALAFLSIWLHEVKNSWFILLVSME